MNNQESQQKPAVAATDKKADCQKCGCQLKSGMKYENVCTTCEPIYLNRCSGCQRQLWDCMCIRPHTWE